MNPDTQIGSSGGAFPIGQPESKGYTINKEGYLEIAGKRCVVKKNNKEVIGTTPENKRILNAVGQIFSQLETSMQSGDVWRIKQDEPGEAAIELRRGQETSTIRKLDPEEINRLKPTSIKEQFKTWVSSVKSAFTNFFSRKKPDETQQGHRKSVSYNDSEALTYNDTQSSSSQRPPPPNHQPQSPPSSIDDSIELDTLYQTFDFESEQDESYASMATAGNEASDPELTKLLEDVQNLTDLFEDLNKLEENKNANPEAAQNEIPRINKDIKAKLINLIQTLADSSDFQKASKALSGEVRLKLIKEIDDLKKDLPNVESTKIDELKKALISHSDTVVGTALLDRIVHKITSKNSTDTIDEYLYLTSKSVINTRFLFELVLKKIEDPNTNTNTLKALLIFTYAWAARNKGTTEFTKLDSDKGPHQIVRITEAVSKRVNNDRQITKLCSRLHDIVANVHRITVEPVTVQPGAITIHSILGNLREDRLGQQYNQTINDIADDLFLVNATFYTALTNDMLAEDKWLNKHPTVNQMSAFADNISKAIEVEILSESDTAKQSRMIKFFIRLADACFQRGDIQSMMMILGAIKGTAIANINDANGRPLLDEVLEASEYKDMYSKMDRIMSTDNNRLALRKLHSGRKNEGKPCIPFMGLYLSDLTFIREGNPAKSAKAHSDEECNEKKLGFLADTISQTLAFSQSIKQALVQTTGSKTNIFEYITEFQEFNVALLTARRKDTEAKRLLRELPVAEQAAVAKAANQLLQEEIVDVQQLSEQARKQLKLQFQAHKEHALGELTDAVQELTKAATEALKQLSEVAKNELEKNPLIEDAILKLRGFIAANNIDQKVKKLRELGTASPEIVGRDVCTQLEAIQKKIIEKEKMEKIFSSI